MTAPDQRTTSLVSFWPRMSGKHPVDEHLLPLPPPPQGQPKYQRSKPHVAQRIVDTYLREGDQVLEICAGWGTFSSVARSNGYTTAAADIWTTSVEFVAQQLAAIPSTATWRVWQSDARKLGGPTSEFDIVYSHLPMPGVQHYGDSPDDLSSKDRDAWGDQLLDVMTEVKRVLKPSGLAIFAAHDRRTNGQVDPYHIDVIAAVRLAGLLLHDVVVYEQPTISAAYPAQHRKRRSVAKTHEYLIVARKQSE